MVYDFLKRLMDIVGSLVGLVILSPLLFLVALAIKLDSEGPVMADTPMRAGKNGKLFRIYKFRSMVQNAHEILEKNPKLLEQYKKNSYKIIKDPRVTRVGKFIRKFSIDEFPQLVNVIKGELSLVGPRPHEPEEVSSYPAEFQHLVLAKAGVTLIHSSSSKPTISSAPAFLAASYMPVFFMAAIVFQRGFDLSPTMT